MFPSRLTAREPSLRLSDLINGATGGAGGPEDVEIRGLAADSREVEDGYLFAALQGQKACGADYISDALRHGAVAVLAPPGTALPPDQTPVQFLTDVNPRRRLALQKEAWTRTSGVLRTRITRRSTHVSSSTRARGLATSQRNSSRSA